MSIIALQRILKDRGHDPGPLDGIWGRKTIAAVKSFQAATGLEEDGVAGPRTLAALYGSGPTAPAPVRVSDRPVWYLEAERLKGLRETAGPGNNPTILGWARKLGGWVGGFYRQDSIPWCGLAVAHFIGATLPEEPLPANPLGALEWAKFGRGIRDPARGAILVFRRQGGGHVGLYHGEDATHYHVLGGNQSDSINITRIAKSRHVATQWPITGSPPAGGRVQLAASGSVSRNEA